MIKSNVKIQVVKIQMLTQYHLHNLVIIKKLPLLKFVNPKQAYAPITIFVS